MVDSFGEALRQLRQDRGWSLAQLARHLSWSKPLVGAVETGRAHPSVEFAIKCDQVFGSTPIMATLCGLSGEDHDMNRRALLGGFSAAVGIGAISSYAALADVIRMDMQEAAGVQEDWDAVIAGYQHRLVTEPSSTFGDELLASMLSARQMMTERRDPDALKASAYLSMIYGIWMGYNGSIGTGQNFYRTAAVLGERSGDPDTHVWVLARTASAGPYQGLARSQTQDKIDQALALAGDKASAGALEAHAASVHLAALTGDLKGGRESVRRMWDIAHRLPSSPTGAGPEQRTVSFSAYLEGKLGSIMDSANAMEKADQSLLHLPQWHSEARLYYALCIVRHGHFEQGLRIALDAARSLRYSVRVIQLGVDDVLMALPLDYRSDLAEELNRHGTTGPKPWELITT